MDSQQDRGDDPSSGLDRRALLRRMAAGGAVVWATPMMHSVAFAQAATSCGDTPGTLNWSTVPIGQFNSTLVRDINVSVTSSPTPGTTLDVTNQDVAGNTTGGVGGNHLHFQMVPDAAGVQQVVTFSFSAPVSSLVIPVYDIDATTGVFGFISSYLDQVIVNTAGHSSVVPAGSNVIGTGTSVDPYRNSVTNASVPPTSDNGNLLLQHPGPTTTFQFTYRNGNQFGGLLPQQWIDIGNITFVC